jgi:DNA-binding response OmpR family regulator
MNTHNPEHARILIVDQDANCLATYQQALTRLGFQNLMLLQDSTEIIAGLPRFQPDLIITELDMPILNGICVVSIVQETTPEGEFLPVLVVTGHASAEAKHEALAAGAADFLLKPCDLAELHARVRNLLRIRALQQQTQAHSLELERTVAKRTHALGKALLDLKETQRMMLQEERLRAFAQMAGSIGTDFNHALQTVTSYSRMLLNKPDALQTPEEWRNTLTTIHMVASDASQVVDRMRDLY